MAIPGNLLTTAMAVMPHTDVERALEMALSLDVPFWPQLPNTSYYEDMYVQAAEHFPGILLDMEKRTLRFSLEKFINEFEETMAHFDEPQYFDISETYSVVYHRFLSMALADRRAIRGQLEGPISFGFNVLDQDERPILFDDTVRPFMLEFLARRVNVQLERLKTLNKNAFMFILPSYSENFGMSVVEAMASGCPVVISDKVGIYKDLVEYQAGIIVTTNVQSIITGIIKIYENENDSCCKAIH